MQIAFTWQMFWKTAIEVHSPDEVSADMQVLRWAVYKARARLLPEFQKEMEGI